ncbi:MAG: glycosyltransferase family 2 protein [Polyangiaceae bacterium]|nr:glycosyltransferase family 2 protein [Polyangiaceae bacterium]
MDALEKKEQPLPSVMAVILTWNDTKMTGACIESLLACDYPNLEILVSDNGSSPPCAPALKERFPQVHTVACLTNRGFTGGANRGLERALEFDPDYVFFLNNDTIVAANAVAKLVEALEADPEAGAASALLLHQGGETIQFFRGEIWRDRGRNVLLDDGVPRASRDHWPTVHTVFAPACAIMYRSRTLRRIGLFDESLGTNWEDYDWCVRAQDRNIPLLCVGAAEVIHDHGQTTGRVSPWITYYSVRNRLICLTRYGRPVGIAAELPYILRSFFWTARAYGLTNWEGHRAFARGVFDFLVGVRGEGHPPTKRTDAKKAVT